MNIELSESEIKDILDYLTDTRDLYVNENEIVNNINDIRLKLEKYL